MSFTQRNVVHQFLDSDGSFAEGVVTFQLSETITNGPVTIVPSDLPTATLDSTGSIAIELAANDDPDTIPAGSTWNVTLQLAGARSDTYSITVPSAGSGDVDLGDLLPGEPQVQ